MKAMTAEPLSRFQGFELASYAVTALGLIAAAVAAWTGVPNALLPLAVLLGWSQLRSV
ncbi:MAG TPA: hypothetical protein VE685_02475 [Thermoanaerobaculia bacterium]|nr:hypothetical protein [Thermoanaerobaculia bacterium]